MSVHLQRFCAATVALAALFISALALNAQPSFADSWVRGSAASASFQSNGDTFRVWDLKCDGKAVYILYDLRDGKPQRELRHNGGCNSMGLFKRNFPENLPIAYKACVSIRFARDVCTDVPGPATWQIDTT